MLALLLVKGIPAVQATPALCSVSRGQSIVGPARQIGVLMQAPEIAQVTALNRE
jgi:hypothetical protein